MNLKRMTEDELWREYSLHSGLSTLIKNEIEKRIKSMSKKSRKCYKQL